MYQMRVENLSKVQIKLLHVLSFRSFALAFSYWILDIQTKNILKYLLTFYSCLSH